MKALFCDIMYRCLLNVSVAKLVFQAPFQASIIVGLKGITLRKIVTESIELIEQIVQVTVKLSLTVEERSLLSKVS